MQIIYQFNSRSKSKWIPEAIKIAEKKDGKLVGSYYQINFTNTKDKDLLKLDFLVSKLKGSKLLINGEKYESYQATYIINSIFNCGFKYPNYQGSCSGKCVYDYNREDKVLVEKYCEILNPKLKNDKSFSNDDYKKELNSFEFNIEDLEWLDQIGLNKSLDKLDYFNIGESQKDAQIYEHHKQYEKAIGKYVEILKLDHIGGHYFDWNMKHIGSLLIELNKYLEAIEVYKKYLEFFPDDEEISNLLDDLSESIKTKKSFSAIRANRFHKEEERAKEPIITEIDDSIKVRYLDFLRYRKSILNGNSFKRKLSLYKENIKEKSHTITAWRNLAYAYLEKNEYQNAIQCYETAIKLGTQSQDLWLWCADAYSESGNYEKAVDLYQNMQDLIDINYFDNYVFHIYYCFEKIVANHPNNSPRINEIISLYQQLLTKSKFDKDLKKFDTIIQKCIKSILKKINPTEISSAYEIEEEDIIEEKEVSESGKWCLRGDALCRIGQYEEANKCYEKAIEYDPKYIEAWLNKGKMLDTLEKREEAIECFNKAIELDPHNPNVWISKMEALDPEVNEEEFLECHRRILEIDDDFYENHKYFAQQENLTDEVQTAEWYNKAFNLDPGDLKGMICRGLELSELGRYEEAIDCYNKALEINPEYKEAWVNKGKVLAIDTYFELTSGNLEKYEEVIDCYDKAIEIDPGYIEAYENKGNALDILGKYEEAIESYNKILEINSRYKKVWLNKGIIFSKLEKFQEAVECYNKALEMDPEYKEAWVYKGSAMGSLRKFKEALQCFDNALEIDNKYIDAWLEKGMALYMLEKSEEAIACFNTVLKMNPRDENAWYGKGIVFDQLKNYEEAIKCYENILEINPWDADSWYYKALDLEFIGKYKEAIKCYDKLLEIDPEDETVRLRKEKLLDMLKNLQS